MNWKIRMFLALASMLMTVNPFYIRSAIVVEQEEDTAFFEDESGNLWAAKTDIEIGEHVILLMDNRQTEIIFDDEILAIVPND